MLWTKKEEKASLPDLPDSKPFKLPSPPKKPEKNALPSFPDSSNEKGFSQSAIKEAVEDGLYTEENELPELPELPESSQQEEPIEPEPGMEEWRPSISSSKEMPEEYPIKSKEIPEKQLSAELPSPKLRSADVFIKIDKFHTAKKSLVLVREKVEEIESLLRKIRETKLREERELSFWENELINIKVKIKDVAENIFEKA